MEGEMMLQRSFAAISYYIFFKKNHFIKYFY